MWEYKNLLGILSIFLSIAGYVPYFRDLYLRRTRPHVFSWFLWGLLGAIAVAAQISDGAGSGSWALLFGATVCFVVAIISIKLGEKNITKSDWITFISALCAIPVWLITQDPSWAIIIVATIDFMAFLPTIRKSFEKPNEETLATWIINSVKFVPALLALDNVSFATAFYPAYLAIINGLFAVMLIWRRRTVISVLIK